MTWKETEELVATAMDKKLSDDELRNVYHNLPFFVAVNFVAILKASWGKVLSV